MVVLSADVAPRWRLPASEGIALAGVGAVVVARALSPDRIEDGPVICPFRLLTGLPCPGCGLTRSWVYLAHGSWGESLAAHPFGVVAVALVLALVAAVIVARVRRVRAPDLDALVRRPWLVVLLGAWMTFAVVRLAVVAS
jgi:hypothetical protein